MTFETKEITYFKRVGKENTEKVLELVQQSVKDTGIKKIVVASSSGEMGIKFSEAFKVPVWKSFQFYWEPAPSGLVLRR